MSDNNTVVALQLSFVVFLLATGWSTIRPPFDEGKTVNLGRTPLFSRGQWSWVCEGLRDRDSGSSPVITLDVPVAYRLDPSDPALEKTVSVAVVIHGIAKHEVVALGTTIYKLVGTSRTHPELHNEEGWIGVDFEQGVLERLFRKYEVNPDDCTMVVPAEWKLSATVSPALWARHHVLPCAPAATAAAAALLFLVSVTSAACSPMRSAAS